MSPRPLLTRALMLAVVAGFVVPAQAQPPAAEHGVIKPLPGSVLKGRPKISKHATMQMRVRDDRSTSTMKTVAGAGWYLEYDIRDESGARDTTVTRAFILGNYESEATKKKGTIHAKTANRLYFSLPREGGGTTWCSLYASTGAYVLDIIDEQPLEVTLTFGADEMRSKLAADGRVAVYGIEFDVDRATLRPESSGVIDEIVKLLTMEPALRLEVQGHTDSTGSADRNRALSAQRAAAVVAALTKAGVASDRLMPRGYGSDRPVGDNATADGRQKNRRVELVQLK